MAFNRQDLLDAMAKFNAIDPEADIVNVSPEMYAECQKLVPVFEYFAGEGDADGECYLAILYWRGKGVPVNEIKAEELFTKAASKDNVYAQYLLGEFILSYYSGMGVEYWVTATEWFMKSAETGFAPAQFEVGVSYDDGRGLEQDKEKAVYWFTKAADQGNKNAILQLARAYYNGRGVEQDTHKAISLWQQAYDMGYIYAIANIAECYFEGKGIEKDFPKALKMYQEALDYSGGRIVVYQKKVKALQEELQKQGLCQYCGGKFKGLFFKKCSACGKKKDYK